MPRKHSGNHKVGRTVIPIDWDMVDKFLEAGSPGTEVAAHFGFHRDTLYDRCLQEKGVPFSVYLAQKRGRGNALIRAKQFAEAMKGDRGMLIWLGKNRLGQSDKFDTKTQGSLTCGIVNWGDNPSPKPWKDEKKEDSKK